MEEMFKEFNFNEKPEKIITGGNGLPLPEDYLAFMREHNGGEGPIGKNAAALYRSLDESQREVFFSILQQTMIDTVSNVLAVLDNVSSLTDEWRFVVAVNDVDTEEGLQDAFLAYVEDRAYEE